MKTTSIFKTTWLAAFLISTLTTALAQTTATWIGPATGGEWNTAANWDAGLPPADATTNAFIGAATNVNYNLPMAAASFGILTNNGVVNVNASGFNCGNIIMTIPGGGENLFINNGGVVNVGGNLTLSTNSSTTLASGGSLTVGSLIVAAGESSAANNTCTFTNSGGTLNANSTRINNNTGTGTGLLVISGGVNNLGNTAIGRYHGTSVSTPGTEGLAIYGGVVTMTNLNIGNSPNGASFLTAYIAGGIVTNYGNVLINNGTASRYSRLLQTGGLFVVPDPSIINPNSIVAGAVTAVYSINGGTNIVGGFYFGNLTNLAAATVNFTNNSIIYIGSQGIASNGAVILNSSLNNGGLFGATADWSGSTPFKINNGTYTMQAADSDGTAHNITLSGVLSGIGTLNKTGAGTLTLSGVDTYSGNTLVNAGSLALGVGGSLSSSLIIVGSGATFDVSALAGAYSPVASQTLSGSGMVNGLVTATAGTINPGSNALTGTLTFANGLSEQGGVINHFDLSSNPLGANNDFISVTGDLTVSGVNTIEPSGSTTSGSAYKLIQYSGNFNGSLANFALSGATTGSLSNNATTKIIYFVSQSSVRSPTNIVWVGNSVTNNWDVELTTNWNNNGMLDFFVPGDSARFDNTGGLNTNVNIAGSVAPSLVTVDSTSNYVFSGNGSIDGTGGLTKTNSGTLTIVTTNNYTGTTTINEGIVEALQLANGGQPGPFGAATSDSPNFVMGNGTLRYSGSTASVDRGATFTTNASGGIDVTNSTTTLTLSGSLVGSGGLTKIGSGTLNLTGGNSYTGATTLSNGTLTVNGVSTIGMGAISFDGGTLSISSSSIQQSYLNTLNVASTGTLIYNGANANNVLQGAWSGAGTLNLYISNPGGNCTFNNDMTTNFTGTILLTTNSAGILRFNGGGNSTAPQQCTGSPTATFDFGTSSVILVNRNGGGANFGTYYLGALAGGVSVTVRGATANSPTIYQIGDKNLSTTFSGIISNGTGGNLASVSIVKAGTGTLTLNGGLIATLLDDGFTIVTNYANALLYTGTTTISNGVLALAVPANLTNSTSITLAASSAVLDASQMGYVSNEYDSDGVTLTNQFLVTNGIFEVFPAQTLAGLGTIRGSLLADAGSIVNVGPADDTGTLSVTSSITLGGTTTLKLNRANAPNSDRLASSSLAAITYGGTLIVTNIGAQLHVGDTFTLFSGSSLSGGTFSSIVLPPHYTWSTANLGVDGTISVSAVAPPPSISSVNTSGLSGGSITLNAVGGTPNAPVTVLTSTNLALPLAQWTVAASGNFDDSGNYSVSISADPAAPHQFYTLQTQ